MTSRIRLPTMYDRAARRDVEHRREHAEEEQRRADVLLVREHDQSHAPRQQQRAEVADRWQVPAPDSHAAVRQQLALVDEIRREEGDQQHLGDLARLEAERTERDPEAPAVDGAPDAGRERQEQEQQAEQQGGVPVSLEDSHVAHDDERENEHADGDRDPHRLRARLRRGRAGRSSRTRCRSASRPAASRVRVGRGREPAHREVRDEVQAEDPRRASRRGRAAAAARSPSATRM